MNGVIVTIIFSMIFNVYYDLFNLYTITNFYNFWRKLGINLQPKYNIYPKIK